MVDLSRAVAIYIGILAQCFSILDRQIFTTAIHTSWYAGSHLWLPDVYFNREIFQKIFDV